MKTLKSFLFGFIIGLTLISATAYAINNSIQAEIYPDSLNIYANNLKVKTPNFLYNDTTYVPLRDIAERVNSEVIWNSENSTVHVHNRYVCMTLNGNNIVNSKPVSVKELYKRDPINPNDIKRYKHFYLISMLGDVSMDNTSGTMNIDPYVSLPITSNTQTTATVTPQPTSTPNYNSAFNPYRNTTSNQPSADYSSLRENEINQVNNYYNNLISNLQKQADSAYERALSNGLSNTGGYMNSAAITAASNARSIYDSQIKQYENERDKKIEEINEKYDRLEQQSNATSQSANATTSYISPVFPLKLYSYDGKVFLGELTTNKYDVDSIFNEFGIYGSKYSINSIWNSYGTYGSTTSNESINNSFATKPPIIVDGNGNLFGYLTTNKNFKNAYTIAQITALLEKYNK